MKNFKLIAYLLFMCTLNLSQYAYSMKKQNTKLPVQKKVEVLTDHYVISNQILPFIETKDLATLRQVGQTMKSGIKLHTEEFRPLKRSEIYPKNINNFLKWLRKNHAGIDFFVAIDINAKNPESKNILSYLEKKNIINKDLIEVFDLIGQNIKELTLSGFDTEKICLINLSKYNIRKIILNDFIGNINPILSALPKNLEELDISSCSGKITKTSFSFMPKTLKILKISSIESNTQEELNFMPKRLTHLYIKEDFAPETLNAKEYQAKILTIKQNGLKVISLLDIEYPTNDQEAKISSKKLDEIMTKESQKSQYD